MRLTVFSVLVLPNLACEFSFSTARLSEAVMCASVDEVTKEPLEKTDVFSPNTSKVFCSVKLSNAPPDTSVKSEWIYVKGELKDLSDYIIDEFTLTASGTTYMSFSLTKPVIGFPKGDYLLKLYLGEKEKITVPFKIN